MTLKEAKGTGSATPDLTDTSRGDTIPEEKNGVKGAAPQRPLGRLERSKENREHATGLR